MWYNEVRTASLVVTLHFKEDEKMPSDFRQNLFNNDSKKDYPLEVRLSDPNYVLRVDASIKHCLKEAPHWHLWYRGKPIARITTYGVWTSWPPVSQEIRLEAEDLTWRYFLLITSACGQSPENVITTLQTCAHYYTEWVHKAPT